MEKKCRYVSAYAMLTYLAVLAWLGGRYAARALQESTWLVNGTGKAAMPMVVIDAGHGGADPGKVGINQALEKDINLSIAKKVQRLLEQNGVAVLLTRQEDTDLAKQGTHNRKAQDMKARAELINSEQPILGISIHQNSYPREDCKGAQVFYFKTSQEGEMLAKMLQKQLHREINDGTARQAKENSDYYLLKKVTCPFAIVECGFLSNSQEAALLVTEEYQEKVAFAIHLGILEYWNSIQALKENGGSATEVENEYRGTENR